MIDRVHWGPVRFTSRAYRRIQIAVWCTLLIGPAFILAGRHDHSRALIWTGAILFPLSGWLIFQSRRFFGYMIPAKKLEEAKRKVLSDYPHGFFPTSTAANRSSIAFRAGKTSTTCSAETTARSSRIGKRKIE
jgi:hypothetical protein